MKHNGKTSSVVAEDDQQILYRLHPVTFVAHFKIRMGLGISPVKNLPRPTLNNLLTGSFQGLPQFWFGFTTILEEAKQKVQYTSASMHKSKFKTST